MNAEAPNFQLHHVIDAPMGEKPAIIPVVIWPWEMTMTRRTFLGACLTIGSVLATLHLGERILESIEESAIAAGAVDPERLTMIAIESGSTDSIEQGYHLRWFSDLPIPENAAPHDVELLKSFLPPNSRKPLVFDSHAGTTNAIEWKPGKILKIDESGRIVPRLEDNRQPLDTAQPDTSKPESDLQKPGINPGVPPAFLIYRRVHQTSWTAPHKILLDRSLLLQARQENIEPIPGVRCSVEKIDMGTTLENEPDWLWEDGGLNPTTVRALLTDKQGHVLKIEFFQPSDVPRAVHRLELFSKGSGTASPVLRGYGEDPDEAVRRTLVPWSNWSQIKTVNWVQGHYYRLDLIAEEFDTVEMHFGYMDEDTYVASNPDKPDPGEWVLIAALPFITSFQRWSDAKSEFFRHPLKNRYIDFGGPRSADDWSLRLDDKYGPLFMEFQRVLLRIRLADMLGVRYLDEPIGIALAGAKYDPREIFHLWSMDPLAASLLSLRFVDNVGPRSSNPPTPGTTYDYMVTSAWQPPAQRLCYIAQKVSKATSPEVLKPSAVVAEQKDGFSRQGDSMLYRVVASWRPPLEKQTSDFGYFEPPLYDVRRSDNEEPHSLLTHRYDNNVDVPTEERIFDSPVHGPLSPPDINDTDEVARLSEVQKAALTLRKTLQHVNTTEVITAAQVAAYTAMTNSPLSRFFPALDPTIEYIDWLGLSPEKSERKVAYSVRSIDLFGRTSGWCDGENLRVVHNSQLPAAENVRVRVNGTPPHERLDVSWRLGAHQCARGAPVNHFNVCWKSASSGFTTADDRRFELWKDQLLIAGVLAQPPITAFIQSVSSSIQGAQLYGNITSVQNVPLSGEHRIWLTGRRLVTFFTDQCFFGPLPFFDISGRYGAVPADLVDQAQLSAGGQTYDIVTMQGGERLCLTVAVDIPGNGSDPLDTLRTAIGSSLPFTLTFNDTKTELAWNQQLNTEHFVDIGVAQDLPISGSFDYVFISAMLARNSLELLVSSPFGVEVTGREEWLTGGAWLSYEYPVGTSHEVSIVDHGTILLSTSEVRFGTALRPATGSPVPVHRSVTLINRSSGMLKVTAVVSNRDEFVVVFNSPVTLGANGELTIDVAFVPGTSSVIGELTIRGIYTTNGAPLPDTNESSVSIRLVGNATDDEAAVEPDQVQGLPRVFLGSLILAPILFDSEKVSLSENPAPIFPPALLATCLQTGTNLQFRIRRAKIRMVTISNPTISGGIPEIDRLLGMRGGDVTFVTQDREFICPVVSRPSPNAEGKLAFVIVEQPNLPDMPVVPIPSQKILIRSVYRFSTELPAELKIENERTNGVNIEIAISTHRRAITDGYSNEDFKSLVSVPERIALAPIQPSGPVVKQMAWNDSFEVGYATIPKILDNRKVVQYKIKLDDPVLMKNMPLAFPENGQLELCRAPEDALRLLILDRMRLSPPTDPASDAEFLSFINLEDNPEFNWHDFVDLNDETERYNFASETFKEMSSTKREQAIAIRLIRYWDHTIYSLKDAFHPIGKIKEPPPILTDEYTGVAAGNVFYAVRELRDGATPSRLLLLPFRVVIADLKSPTKPLAAKSSALDGSVTLSWTPNKEADLYAYKIYRSESSIYKMSLIKTVYVDPDNRPSGGELVKSGCLVLTPTTRRLSVKRLDPSRLGTVDLFFSIEILGIATPEKILGVFKDNPPPSWKVSTYDLSEDPKNCWLSGISQVSANGRTLEGIDLAHSDEIVIIFLNNRGRRELLKTIAYHNIPLFEIPADQRDQINGIYPQIPLTVLGGRIPLIFNSSVHGIAMTSQIRGVYRAKPDPRDPSIDPGYGAAGALNHWTNVWPLGSPNTAKGLSSDTMFIEGIVLPRGTKVIVEFEDENGVLQTKRNVLDLAEPTQIDQTFFGLLSRQILPDPATDPPNIFRVTINGNPSPTEAGEVDTGIHPQLKALGMKFDPILSSSLLQSTPVIVRYGMSTQKFIKDSSTKYEFTDIASINQSQFYRIVAVRRVKTGKETDDYCDIDSE